MEKCILYISELPRDKHGLSVPVGLSNIYSTAQRMNAAFGISGILSYKRGYYLQVLEGEGSHIDHLYRNILADHRHHNPLTIVDTEIKQRSFPDRSMQLIVPVSSNQGFVRFIDRIMPHFKAVPESRLKLLRVFFPALLIPDSAGTMQANPVLGRARVEYEKWDYRLTGWPNFTGIDISVSMLSICARLVRQRSPYRALLESDPAMRSETLDQILDKLNRTGMLRISAPGHASAQRNYSVAVSRPSEHSFDRNGRGSRGFLSKLKGLIDTRIR